MSHLQRMQFVEVHELYTVYLQEITRTKRIVLIPAIDEMTDVGYEPIFRAELTPSAHVPPASDMKCVVQPTLGRKCPRWMRQ